MSENKKYKSDGMTDGEAELYLYKFKRWLGSVSREIQNRSLKAYNQKKPK